MFYGFNRMVACEPPDAQGPQVQSTPGLKSIVNANRLIGAKVVFGIRAEDLSPGDMVYVRGNVAKPAEIDFDGRKLVLIDLGTVVLVRREPTPSPARPELNSILKC